MTILGEQYTIRAEEDPVYIRRVAQYVDAKVAEVVKGSPSLPTSRAIILASLNIADELFKLKTEREESQASVAARLGELSELLEAELGLEASGRVGRRS